MLTMKIDELKKELRINNKKYDFEMEVSCIPEWNSYDYDGGMKRSTVVSYTTLKEIKLINLNSNDINFFLKMDKDKERVFEVKTGQKFYIGYVSYTSDKKGIVNLLSL